MKKLIANMKYVTGDKGTMVLKLDYDLKYSRKNVLAIREWIINRCRSIEKIKNIKCKYLIIRKSQGGNIHAYIHLNKYIPIEDAILLELYFASDPYRAYFNYIRITRGYDLRILFNTKQYINNENNNENRVKWKNIWICEDWKQINNDLYQFQVKCLLEFKKFMENRGVKVW